MIKIEKNKFIFLHICSILLIFLINNLAQCESLYPIVLKNRVGYINRNGEIIVKPKFETQFQISYNLYQNKYYPFYELPENAYFSEGKAVFRQSWKILFIKFGYDFGVVDSVGKIIIPKQEIEYGPFHCNRSKIKIFNNKFLFLDEAYTYVNPSGEIISNGEPVFSYASNFSDNAAIVLVNDKYYYIDTLCKSLFDKGFENAEPFQNGTAAVKIDSLWGIIDKTGNLIIPSKYLRIWSKSNGFYRVYDGRNYAFINDKEVNLFKNSFPRADDFSEGYASVKFGEFDYGFIDTLGNIAFKFDNCNAISSFHNGLARVQIGEKWGYINTKGEFTIKPQYDYAIDFSDGFALVWQGNNVYIINSEGKHIWQYYFGEENGKK